MIFQRAGVEQWSSACSLWTFLRACREASHTVKLTLCNDRYLTRLGQKPGQPMKEQKLGLMPPTG